MTAATEFTPYVASLNRDGYCIIPDLVSARTIAELESDLAATLADTPFGDGDFYGYQTKRIGSLLRRSARAADLVSEPTILAIANALLEPACDRIQLNVAQAIEIHPGEIAQFPHCDHDMWGGAKGSHEYLVNVMWPLTPFTALNGATRIYPGSHRQTIEALDQLGEPVIAACEPGSAICFLGSTIHHAGANCSGAVRRGVVVGYSLGWLKPYENQWLAYPPEIARTFPRELAELVGYAQHRPNLGNYEGQCPSILLGHDVPAYPRATDALRPDQAAAVAEYARTQRERA